MFQTEPPRNPESRCRLMPSNSVDFVPNLVDAGQVDLNPWSSPSFSKITPDVFSFYQSSRNSFWMALDGYHLASTCTSICINLGLAALGQAQQRV